VLAAAESYDSTGKRPEQGVAHRKVFSKFLLTPDFFFRYDVAVGLDLKPVVPSRSLLSEGSKTRLGENRDMWALLQDALSLRARVSAQGSLRFYRDRGLARQRVLSLRTTVFLYPDAGLAGPVLCAWLNLGRVMSRRS